MHVILVVSTQKLAVAFLTLHCALAKLFLERFDVSLEEIAYNKNAVHLYKKSIPS
jgi:hypothetical protein